MRLTIEDKNKHLVERVEIYLDGEKQDNCTVADEEKGYIVQYTGETAKEHMMTETVYGVVKIVDPFNEKTE